MTKRKGFEYNGKWFSIWNDWKFKFVYYKCGYFDPRPELDISIFGLHMLIRLPWKDKKWANECDSPGWGIWIYKGVVYIECGGKGNLGGNKTKAIYLPFFTKKHICHLVETKDGKMTNVNELGSGKPYVYYADDDRVRKYKTIYIDSYDGAEIECEYWKESREWRPKWLEWTSLFATKHNYIEINFKEEVGKEKGSWKGGVTGCSYTLNPGETPAECIKRMKKEKQF